MNKIIWIDTETTGLSPKKNGLREVAFIAIVDGVIVKENLLYINPNTYNKEVQIEDTALELSGKTLEDLIEYGESQYHFEYFYEILTELIDKDDKNDYWTLAGYNTNFDIGFLKDWFYDNGKGKDFYNIFHYKAIDVFPLVITLKHLKLIDTENDRLETICKYFNIPISAHSALSDIVATKLLYELITNEYIKKVPTFRDIEFAIKDHFLIKGYKVGIGGWGFSTKYKDKNLTVYFAENSSSKPEPYYTNSNENVDQLFIDTYEHFKDLNHG